MFQMASFKTLLLRYVVAGGKWLEQPWRHRNRLQRLLLPLPRGIELNLVFGNGWQNYLILVSNGLHRSLGCPLRLVVRLGLETAPLHIALLDSMEGVQNLLFFLFGFAV